MTIDVVTLFPTMFVGPLADGVLARARREGRFGVRVHDLRRFGVGPNRQVDDAPFGGGVGMVLKPEPLFEAVAWIHERWPTPGDRVVLLSPRGRPLDAGLARRLAGTSRLIVLCGRYEGVDERVAERLADEEVSLADVVLTGGEIPAMALVDAVARFVPGVLGNALSAERDSFENGLLDHAHYTRPARYRGLDVPSVLLGGDHAAVERWRALGAREATRTRRPDLWTPFDTNAPAGRARG